MVEADKEAVFNSCKKLLEMKMEETLAAMLAAQESANSNEKSSMGDKYETGRAMSQLERDMHAKQLAKWQDEYQKLLKIDLSHGSKTVAAGSLVQTETHVYWIAIALGQIETEKGKVMVVSPASPVAQAMLGKKKKESFSINAKVQTIVALA